MLINHKVKGSFAVSTSLVLTFSVIVGLAWGSGKIENISLKKDGKFTTVTISADGPFTFTHSTEEAKDGKSYRLILDCKDLVFGLPQNNFREGLPPGMIRAIRTSQFQVVPDKVVRVVLDLKGPVVYKVVESKSGSTASIALLTTQDADFPAWLAVKESTPEAAQGEVKSQLVQSAKKAIEPIPVQTVSKAEPSATQAEVTSPKTEGTAKRPDSEKTVTGLTEKGRTFRKAVSYSDTGEAVQPKKENSSLVLHPQAVDQGVKANQGAENTQIAKTVPQMKVSVKSEAAVGSASATRDQSRPASTQTQAVVAKTETEVGKRDESSQTIPSTGLVNGSLPQTKPEPTRLSSTSMAGPKADLPLPPVPRQISRSPVPLGPFPAEQHNTTDSTVKTKMVEVEEKKATATETGSAIKRGVGAILGTKGASAKETDTLSESPPIIENAQQPEKELVPERKLVSFNPETKRDPFAPLSEKQDINFEAAPLPRFESLKLVGIIRDKSGNQALLEDEIGFGYILKMGDKIKNGYVVSVEDNQVVFHVQEYGEYRTMTLDLKQE
ncbi:MAG: AMIN domain-containing protein [Candidatus Zixiibacteriota bacterium]